MASLVRSGVVCCVNKVRCVANLVLVPGHQSGQPFRVCYNAINLNARSAVVDYPFADKREILDSCSRAAILSAMDIKAGYHNVRCMPRMQEILGITTQDGLYKWVRMPFSPQQALACF